MSKKVKRNYDDYIFIRLPADTKPLIAAKAESEGLTMTGWIRQLVLKGLKK